MNCPKLTKTIALWALSGVLICAANAEARSHNKAKANPAADDLEQYLARARMATVADRTAGSLWSDGSPFTSLASDDKAYRLNDLLVIHIVEQTQASADGNVKSARSLSASSGIGGLLGQVGPTSGIQTLFSPQSQSSLDGQTQTASNSSLNTSLTATVAEVLPNGNLVIQAVRQLDMNNQHQMISLRGIVRSSDIAPDNSVASTAISDLEVTLQGRGVISDGVRPPNRITSAILRLLGF
jgi:flagellar L-ring protein FlgH